MSEKRRRKVIIERHEDASLLGHITNEELLDLSLKYDLENYNPLENLNEKIKLVPDNKSEVITIRISKKENILLNQLSKKEGLSKSSYLRTILRKAISENNDDIAIRLNRLEKNAYRIEALNQKLDKILSVLDKQPFDYESIFDKYPEKERKSYLKINSISKFLEEAVN